MGRGLAARREKGGGQKSIQLISEVELMDLDLDHEMKQCMSFNNRKVICFLQY